MFQNLLLEIVGALLFSWSLANAQIPHHKMSPAKMGFSSALMGPENCQEAMMIWDRTTASCIVLPMEGMPMGMWMVHGNGFLVQDFQEVPRGRNRLAAPHMLMADVGQSLGDQYFDVNLMLSFEKWTFPKEGDPELLQIGEKNEESEPYIDAQHPHSSPMMGLTFSDTVRLYGEKNYLRLFFAPRGQATEGPIAFLHRETGQVNPDAPLGHHIGQDVSHITSTVLGASVNIEKVGVEASFYNGREPEPAKVDLPMGPLNSYGTRISYEFSDRTFAMISAAEIKDPEPDDPELEKVWRYSGSLYTKHKISDLWLFQNTLIYGHVSNYDHVSVLRSVLDEFWIHQSGLPHQYWGRIEFVERTGAELSILDIAKPREPQWVTALTAGYTYHLGLMDGLEGGVGASLTKDILPSDFRRAYSGDPVTAKIFLQLSGMKMGQF